MVLSSSNFLIMFLLYTTGQFVLLLRQVEGGEKEQEAGRRGGGRRGLGWMKVEREAEARQSDRGKD